MRNCRKIFKFFSFFALFVLTLFLSSPKVNAKYDSSLNKVIYDSLVMDPTNDKFSITIQYQYQVRDVQVYICDPDQSSYSCELSYKSYLKDVVDFADEDKGMVTSTMNSTGHDTLTYLFEPVSVYDGDHINNYANGQYKVVVKASFCLLRDNNLRNCEVWEANDDNSYPTIFESVVTIKSAYTDDVKINQVIDNLLKIINSYVIPVLWILLGIVFVVRGVLLSIDIVKASDESEVRQKKISGLVWLVIGVFAGYAITIAAHTVMGIFGYGGIFS